VQIDDAVDVDRENLCRCWTDDLMMVMDEWYS
jgi:hypothetical protein